MNQIKPPQNIPKTGKKLFLAGSIEMGRARDWQKDFVESIADTDWTLLNPRRDNWDELSQEDHYLRFREQVEWELSALEASDIIVMYLEKGTKSPISLLELGLYARSNKLIVICDEGFWREVNVQVVCDYYEVKKVRTLEEAVSLLKAC